MVKSENKGNEMSTNQSFPIIGIGSSAGGLKALEEFFDHCPSDTGFAFVIVQHLSPDYKSLMPELLSRHTKMKVAEAQRNEKVKPDHVYLIPGNKNIIIRDGYLVLTKRPPNNQMNFSVDIFFKSLAVEKRDKAICFILSGTGSDGTKGAKSIKEVGGTLFVQSPESARFDGMPRSAISQGLADFVLSPGEMPAELVDFVAHDSFNISSVDDHIEGAQSLERILKMIKSYVGYDFLSYKKPTLFRRTAKRMSITKNKTVADYINYLYEYPEEKFILAKEFLIGVTKFFRDQEAFDELKQKVIPNIVRAKQGSDEPIKVWVVACSTGEEAYSIAILLEEYFYLTKQKGSYKIFATDINEKAVDIASKGVYKESIASEIPQTLLNKYFTVTENSYQINPAIRSNIIFSKHDILQNPPFNKMDLVSCRNMLIYMNSEIQLKVLTSIHFALNEKGYLFIGNSENIGLLDKNFDEVSSKWKIYRNLKPGRLVSQYNNDIWKIGVNAIDSRNGGKKEKVFDKMIKSINSMLMEDLGVVCACVDEGFEIIQASGKLKKYIEFPEEGFTNNLMKMLPDELAIPLTTMIRKIGKSDNNSNSIERIVKILQEDILKEIKLVVKELSLGSVYKKSYLILFFEQKGIELNDLGENVVPSVFAKTAEVEELKEALTETRENLQSTIEELETTNEEMQATNEELMASNEELQSTNEELQSLNEELHTVNAELQEKNTQLLESNSDIENLIKNVNIGTVFLDRNFNIRKFTPAIHQHFQLRVEDIGRPIHHFSGTLGGQDLMELSKTVINTLQSYKREVQSADGTWFSMQIFPYRNQEHVIRGVVINFINIHETKTALKETARANEFLTHLIDTNPGIIYIYDLVKKQNIYSSDNIAKIAGYTGDEIRKLGANLAEKLFHPDDLKAIEKHHKRLKSLNDGEILEVEYRIKHKISKEPIWIYATDKVNERDENGDVISVLGLAQNIDKVKSLQSKLMVSESRLQLAIKGNRAALWEWSDFIKNKAWWSKEFYQLLGYDAKSLKLSFSSFINLIHPEDITKFRKSLEEQVEEQEGLDEDVRIKTKNDGYRWYRVNAKAQKEINGDIQKIVGTLIDIHSKKQSENKMKQLNVELERFAYLASHDLKEPLRTVTSFTKLFKQEYSEVLDENGHTYLDFIENASGRMITLTNDLLQYSQLDDKSLSFETVDLNQIVKEILQDLQKTIDDNKAKILVEKLPEITCDTVQIRQLFQNLISNSLKYRKPDVAPIIQIGSEPKRRDYQFFVKDNGIGIKKEYHEKIFEVFKRLHSQEEYEGTGIGLANCKRIVDNHNGRIWVKSASDKGSSFYFSIAKLTLDKKHEKDELHTAGR
ncbi:hypothetical protein GCM10009430_07630 [Aquimarina litoralis]|uniref:histidine kinase n=2 Tax=Aquimarina litoralis TaxID=584605 RepID=A0ABN1IIE1_9FLAO